MGNLHAPNTLAQVDANEITGEIRTIYSADFDVNSCYALIECALQLSYCTPRYLHVSGTITSYRRTR